MFRLGNLGCEASLAVKVLLVWVGLAGTVVHANDQAKADKRLRQISAMAADPAARAIINQTMADVVHGKRIELQRQRHAMNLSYGSLFIAHQLKDAGTPMLNIALELERGKTIIEIANERHINWKAIAAGANQLEDKIEDNIYHHFQHPNADKPAPDEKYDAGADFVAADGEFTKAELASAREVYVFWRDRAAGPQSKSVDSASETVLGKGQDGLDRGERLHRVPF
jgi:hypothetical protein